MELLLFNFLKLKYNGEEQIIQQIYRIGPRQKNRGPPSPVSSLIYQ